MAETQTKERAEHHHASEHETKAETKAEEKAETKAEEKAEKKTKFKIPDGFLTPVEATHKLQKEKNPATGEPYAKATMSTQQMYTLLNAHKTNKCPVIFFDEHGHKHAERVEAAEDNSGTRPGFDWDELVEWWTNRPARGSKKADEEKSDEAGESKAEASEDAVLDEEEELGGDEEDFVEAELQDHLWPSKQGGSVLNGTASDHGEVRPKLTEARGAVQAAVAAVERSAGSRAPRLGRSARPRKS